MSVRLGVLRTGRALLHRNTLLYLWWRLSKPHYLVQSEGLGILKTYPVASQVFELATLRLVALLFNQLRYRVSSV
jgi:hypothetical protein